MTDIDDAHLHVKALNGPISLTDIRNSYLDIHSARGSVNLHTIREVNSGSGRITYDGDPGRVGEYLLTSHTGDLEVSIPANAWVEIKARSIKGQSDPEFPSVSSVPTMGQINLIGKPGKIGSRFELRSFSGKIRLKRPDRCRFQRILAVTTVLDPSSDLAGARIDTLIALVCDFSVEFKHPITVVLCGRFRNK